MHGDRSLFVCFAAFGEYCVGIRSWANQSVERPRGEEKAVQGLLNLLCVEPRQC